MLVRGYRLKIFDAYRPAGAVKHFVLWGIEDTDIRMKPYFYPDLDKEELFMRGYIASKSSHSRGSTVDLTLLDMRTGKEVDMGSPFDMFSEISHPDYKGITEEQYENRMELRNAMIRNGFEPIDCEWWHYTLRDEPFPDTYFEFPVSSEYLRRRD
jgi:D-alanyl-D-alanine dipeptidase